MNIQKASKKLQPKRPFPVPEALPGKRGGKWCIEESPAGTIAHGRTGILEKRMLVPLTDDPHAALVRAHELAHAAWSVNRPDVLAKRWGVRLDSVLCAEDMRVNAGLYLTGVRIQDGMVSPKEWEIMESDIINNLAMAEAIGGERGKALHNKIVARLVSAYVAVALPRANGEDARRQGQLIRTVVPEAWPVVENLESNIRNLWRKYRDRARVKGKRMPGVIFTKKLAEMVDVILNEIDPPIDPPKKIKHRPGAAIWGDMEIQNPPLRLPRRDVRMAALRRVSRKEGFRIRGLHRVWSDGQVFRVKTKRKQEGGTVLIDASGSMHWGSKDIETILKLVPSATVAFYEGGSNSKWAGGHYDDTVGRLVIAAARGKMISPSKCKRQVGLNIVDGPALEWLEKQAEPRYWVSDGLVTGKHEKSNPMLNYAAQGIVHRGRITRLPNMDAVKKAFGWVDKKGEA